MECSKESLKEDDEKEGGRQDSDKSIISQIFRLVRTLLQANAGKAGGRAKKRQRRFGKGPGGERDNIDDDDEEEDVSMVDIRARVTSAGFTEAQLMQCIVEVGFPFLLHFIIARQLTAHFTVRKLRCLDACCKWFEITSALGSCVSLEIREGCSILGISPNVISMLLSDKAPFRCR